MIERSSDEFLQIQSTVLIIYYSTCRMPLSNLIRGALERARDVTMKGLKETGGPWGEGLGFVLVFSPASYNSWPANNGQCLSEPFRIRQRL